MTRRSGWQYATAGLFIASIAAVISYNDGLFVARLAGNHDRQAFLYPFLPDGLIVVGLLALLEAARRGIPRSRWATGAVLLGIGMTLAMNAGAGIAHSVLDAVLDGLVPVTFFVAAEVVLWHVRRGRGGVDPSIPRVSPAASPRASLPTMREIQDRQKCSPTTAKKIRAEVAADRRSRGGQPIPAHAPAAQDAPATDTHPPAVAGALNGRADG